MVKKRISIGTLSLLAVSALITLFTGCGSRAPGQVETAPDPFTVVWGPEREQVVVFSGNSAGHVAGEVSEFMLEIGNSSEEPWQGEYLVQLLDTENIVLEIDHGTFDVAPGADSEIDIEADFGSGLDGPYGLSLYIPGREAQSIQTIWIGEKSTISPGPWPSIASHPQLWPEKEAFTEEKARQLAEEFVRKSPTFTFDGMEGSLELVETLYPDIENAWQFIYSFDSRHAGYGDRTGQGLAQVITSHEASVVAENGQIKTAILDNKWDMLDQTEID